MSRPSPSELRRAPSVRFIESLALSMTGGALLVAIGATAAHADEATTRSTGAGETGTGSATATGNRSTAAANQGGAISGGTGALTVVQLDAQVHHTGVAAGNSGGNVAVGNSSNNGARAEQTSSGAGAANHASVANQSDGSARIFTGAVNAVGNDATTSISQHTAAGALGGVITQQAEVHATGLALANSGFNGAVGNDSASRAVLDQDASVGGGLLGGLAASTGDVANSSDGLAVVTTGSAGATGSTSRATIGQQVSAGDGDGAGGDPPPIITQDGLVVDVGLAVANSGLDFAWGNSSGSLAAVGQDAASTPTTGPGLAANTAEVANATDGTGRTDSGEATAVGNESTSEVRQHASTEPDGAGGQTVTAQAADVANAGFAEASTGLNLGVGNATGPNVAAVVQGALVDGAATGLAANQARATNTSDGSGSVHSGDATAVGTRSLTFVEQVALARSGTVVQDQDAEVVNAGIGLAYTGSNTGDSAVGNLSVDTGTVAQLAAVVDPDPATPSAGLATNTGSVDNASDGDASVRTGHAAAIGNDAATHVHQQVDPGGVVVQEQQAEVLNAGVGFAATGFNRAFGNARAEERLIAFPPGVDPELQPVVGELADGYLALGGLPMAGDPGGPTDLIGPLFELQQDVRAGISAVLADGLLLFGPAALDAADHLATFPDDVFDGLDDAGADELIDTALADPALGALAGAVGTVVGGLPALPLPTFPLVGVLPPLPIPALPLLPVIAEDGAPVEIAADEFGAVAQRALVTPDGDLDGLGVANNAGSHHNQSDGSASITTGSATGVGNRSTTVIGQSADGEAGPLGGVVQTQAATSVQLGYGAAHTGFNTAIGNWAFDTAVVRQGATLGGTGSLNGLEVIASNSAEASNASDGTAIVVTGDASALGTTSTTALHQQLRTGVTGLGAGVANQDAAVLNVGLAAANSGANALAADDSPDNPPISGNRSSSDVFVAQQALIDAAGSITAPTVAATNAARAGTVSDGRALVATGTATATGNRAVTDLAQQADLAVHGLGVIVADQRAVDLNAGAAIANSGLNDASGNLSGLPGPQVGLAQQANLTSTSAPGLAAAGPVTAGNQAEATATSDGTASIRTGAASAEGSTSTTGLTQRAAASIAADAVGVLPVVQRAGVLDAGIGVANSGLGVALGNASGSDGMALNGLDAAQEASASEAAGLVVLGPLGVDNTASVGSSSGGNASSTTGSARAVGNHTNDLLLQEQIVGYDGAALVLAPQSAATLNAGLGLANSGFFSTQGNRSSSFTNAAGPGQVATFAAATPTVVGPTVVGNALGVR